MSHKTPPSLCPACASACDAATGITTPASPKPGDVSICWYCAEVLQYADDLTVERCDDESIRRDPEVERIRAEVIGANW